VYVAVAAVVAVLVIILALSVLGGDSRSRRRSAVGPFDRDATPAAPSDPGKPGPPPADRKEGTRGLWLKKLIDDSDDEYWRRIKEGR